MPNSLACVYVEIGAVPEYFGFDADKETFAVIWTDTRTGVQELFYDRVHTTKTSSLFDVVDVPAISAQVLAGVTGDEGGLIIVGGKIIKIPPRGPTFSLLQSMIALDAAERIDHPMGTHLMRGVAETIEGIAKDMVKKHLQINIEKR